MLCFCILPAASALVVSFELTMLNSLHKCQGRPLTNLRLTSLLPTILPQCAVHCAVCSVQCAVCSVQCAVCSVQCAVCTVHCAVHCAVRREVSHNLQVQQVLPFLAECAPPHHHLCDNYIYPAISKNLSSQNHCHTSEQTPQLPITDKRQTKVIHIKRATRIASN